MLPILLCLTLALAQAQPRDPRSATTGTAVIRGRVYSAGSGVPLRDAKVSLLFLTDARAPSSLVPDRPTMAERTFPGNLTPSRTETAVTDAAGRFEFPALPAGQYRVIATAGPNRGRYLPAGFASRRPNDAGRLIVVTAGQDVSADIALPGASAMEGRVVDDAGEPVTGALVSAARVIPGSPVVERVAGFPAHTDDLGRFRLYGLEPGSYVVAVEGTRTGTAVGGGESFITTFHPSSVSVAGAQRVQIAAGQDVAGVDIQYIRSRRFSVSGTVIDSQGQPFGGASATLVKPALGGLASQYVGVDGHGRFALSDLDPGEYKLEVRAPRRGSPDGRSEFAEVALQLTGDLPDLTVVTRPGITLSGRLVFADGGVPDGALPAVALYDGAVDSRVRYEATARLDADQRFAFSDVFGAKLLRLAGPQHYALTAVLLGGADITDAPTVFRPEHDGLVEVVVTARAAALDGQVKDDRGAAAPDSTMILFPEDRASWKMASPRVRVVEVDEGGRFSVPALAAGRYLAVAVANEGFRIPSFAGEEMFALLSGAAVPVTLKPGERRALDLPLARWPE